MISFKKIESKLKTSGKYWIAFVGDSITSTEWVHPNWREIVQYVLQNEMTNYLKGNWKLSEWGIKGFNFGYDGATTKDILDNLDSVKMVNPDLVILMIGGNDAYLNVSIKEHSINIKNLLKKFNNLYFLTDNYFGNAQVSNKYLPYVESDIKQNFKNFINLFEISKEFPHDKIYTFKSEAIPEMGIDEGNLDYVHPNQLGNAYIAKVILKEIFNVNFDPEKYIRTTLSGEKYPNY